MFFLLLLVGYTALLLWISHVSKRQNQTAGQFLVGGRRFGTWTVFVLMTAMWGASMFSIEIDTAYAQGFSAVWFGVATIVASLLIASFLLKPFRNIGYLTNSNLIGRGYGRKARNLAAIVIGMTFPIFAMKNVLAAASFLHVILGWNPQVVLILTTLIVILYVSLGGLWSLAYVQIINLVLFTTGLLVAAFFALRQQPVWTATVPQVPQFHSLFGVGMPTILVWMGMSLLNSVSAQAEFQTISAAKDTRRGKRGVYLSSIALVGFAVLPTLLGRAAREHLGTQAGGLLAFPVYLREVAPPWAVVLVGLAFWSAALIWCAPLMFSGASSFGLDLLNRKEHSLNTQAVRRFTRLSLLIQGVMIVLYALARPSDLAWWAVFGLTLRNAAIVGPTITFLLWPLVTEGTVVMSMILGVSAGFGWNALTGFSATQFVAGINPMWVGTGTSLVTILIGTFLATRGRIGWIGSHHKRRLGITFTVVGLALLSVSLRLPHTALHALLGADAFLGILALFFAAILLTVERDLTQVASVRAS